MSQVRLTTAISKEPGTDQKELVVIATTKLPNGKQVTAQGTTDEKAIAALRTKVTAAKKLAEVREEYPKSLKVEW